MRSYCLYKGKYLDIADMYEVIDGKQINIPEKLDYYRSLSNTHKDLTCPCGCGEVVVLVAGSVRRQHFRLLKKFENTNCEYQEESELSIKSKIILKCWLSKNLPETENEVRYRVSINELTDNKRKYEISIYSPDYNFGIVYNRLLSNIVDAKIKLQKEYLETKILYVTPWVNEYNDDQYPEHMMKIQKRQGYCFYLDMEPETLYEEVNAKVCVYMKDYKGLWKSVPVCEGMLDQYGITQNGEIVFEGKRVLDLLEDAKEDYQSTQDKIVEQIRLNREKEEKERQEWLEQIRKDREEQERLRREEEARREQERIQREKELAIEQAKIAAEKEKREKEKKLRKKREQELFLQKYPKFDTIYKLLGKLKSIKGYFESDQSNGRSKGYEQSLQIQSIKINMDRHRIEVIQDECNKAYFYVQENNAPQVHRPGTGTPYKILDYTTIGDVEQLFKKSFICVFKDQQECTALELECQFLGSDNICMCETACQFQRKMITDAGKIND